MIEIMHVKLLEAIGKFLDRGYVTQYSIEGYYGFAYLTIPARNPDTLKVEDQKWHFYAQADGEVKFELVGIENK